MVIFLGTFKSTLFNQMLNLKKFIIRRRNNLFSYGVLSGVRGV